MRFLAAFPLLACVVVIYDIAVLVFGANLAAPMFTATIPSGAGFVVTNGEAMVVLGVALLYGEILKSTRTSQSSILDHGFSMAVFIVCLIEFLVIRAAGTGVFFIIMMMTLLDVVAGFTVTITSARRDWGPSDR